MSEYIRTRLICRKCGWTSERFGNQRRNELWSRQAAKGHSSKKCGYDDIKKNIVQ